MELPSALKRLRAAQRRFSEHPNSFTAISLQAAQRTFDLAKREAIRLID